MSIFREQRHIETPVSSVWDLVAYPDRYPDWFPNVIEVRGDSFQTGDDYAQVDRTPVGKMETTMLVDQRDELREIHMTCQRSGRFIHWRLTEARGGTFVDLEGGMNPIGWQWRAFDRTAGRLYLRRWLAETADAVDRAATSAETSTTPERSAETSTRG